jgi:acetyl esterase/lipase
VVDEKVYAGTTIAGEETNMTKGTSARRDALSGTAAAGTPAYDPRARYDLAVSEVELRRNAAGRMLMARIYQPKGPGPFPTVLDLHGGAWNAKDRLAEEPMDRALAATGLLVVAVDLTRGAGSALSGLRAGRQLRGALAQGECRDMER